MVEMMNTNYFGDGFGPLQSIYDFGYTAMVTIMILYFAFCLLFTLTYGFKKLTMR